MLFKIITVLLAGAFLMYTESSSSADENYEKATFAGGCFWCMESPFEDRDGVIEVVAGYTGGLKKNPTYKEVSSGGTGHLEAVQVTYDPSKITFAELLDIFWRQVDPTDTGGQFVDRGLQYTTAIFYHTPEQKREAMKSRDMMNASGMYKKPIVTEIRKAMPFYEAEDYHQDFHLKSPQHYFTYRSNSGRDNFLGKVWRDNMMTTTENKQSAYQKPVDAELKKRLTPLQYKVTQKEGTEQPFNNTYWDNKKDGIYVDIVSGEPLFSSRDKYDSGCGWPSFTKPINAENIVMAEDRSLFSLRIEVRSKNADSHLGHVFDDGPPPTGSRYCINSAALRFVAREDLEKEGYGEYRKLFE